MTDSSIRIEPPLPCSTIQGDRLCRKPATIGLISSWGEGMYMLQPICRDCVAAMARIYMPVKPAGDDGAES